MNLGALSLDPHSKCAPASQRPCQIGAEHDPHPIVTQAHHTFPKFLQAVAYGMTEDEVVKDPRFDATTADLCGTHHDSVHAVIRRLLGSDQDAWRDRVEKAIFDLAVHAVKKYQEACRA